MSELVSSFNPVTPIQDVFSILGAFWGSCWLLISLGLAFLVAPKIIQAVFDYMGNSNARKYDRYYKKYGKKHPYDLT